MRRKQFIPSAHIYTYSSEKETIVEIGFGIAIENSKIDIFFFLEILGMTQGVFILDIRKKT